MTLTIGYSRVSTNDQNTASQEDALTAAGCTKVYVDHYTGTKSSRPEWDRCKDALRSGDTLVITRLDRLGRSTKDLLEISQWLQDAGVNLKATEQQIDTSTSAGRMFFTIIAAVAEFEHDLTVARTRDGLAAARARGRVGGRKPVLTKAKALEVRRMYDAGGKTVQQIADVVGVSRATVYRSLSTE
jgi:DNA invertase Pin-like site-specific DNA recombinase